MNTIEHHSKERLYNLVVRAQRLIDALLGVLAREQTAEEKLAAIGQLMEPFRSAKEASQRPPN